ncbi:hypothetical protein LIER_37371 [Lithospermum erythrorhizon]|uniref:Uncharacterized protein n=1 Tax=Lithospermum erythrorhizon TaxID=34254 RepID=A0AAV3PJH6_LITER
MKPGGALMAGSGSSRTSSGIPGVSSEQIQQLLSLLGTTPANDRLDGEFSFNLWLMDMGASNHVTGNLSLLSDLCDMPSCMVGLPDESRAVSVNMARFDYLVHWFCETFIMFLISCVILYLFPISRMILTMWYTVFALLSYIGPALEDADWTR